MGTGGAAAAAAAAAFAPGLELGPAATATTSDRDISGVISDEVRKFPRDDGEEGATDADVDRDVLRRGGGLLLPGSPSSSSSAAAAKSPPHRRHRRTTRRKRYIETAATGRAEVAEVRWVETARGRVESPLLPEGDGDGDGEGEGDGGGAVAEDGPEGGGGDGGRAEGGPAILSSSSSSVAAAAAAAAPFPPPGWSGGADVEREAEEVAVDILREEEDDVEGADGGDGSDRGRRRDLGAQQLPPDLALSLPYDGTNGSHGTMFDVTSSSYKGTPDLVIRALALHVNVADNHCPVSVYTKSGTHRGYERDEEAWTLIFDGTIQCRGYKTRSLIPPHLFSGPDSLASTLAQTAHLLSLIKDGQPGGDRAANDLEDALLGPSSPLFLAPNSTRAFYVHLANPNLRYTNGKNKGELTGADSVIEVRAGSGLGGKFDLPYSPRHFNGVVYYEEVPKPTYATDDLETEVQARKDDEVCDGSVATTFNDTIGSYGSMFDVSVPLTLEDGTPHPGAVITGMDLYTDVDFEVSFEVYVKDGSHRDGGGMGDMSVWSLIAIGEMEGKGLTRRGIPIDSQHWFHSPELKPGQTISFYTTLTSPDLRYTDADDYSRPVDVGDVFTRDPNVQIKVGMGVAEYPLGTMFYGPRIWNGRIHYAVNAVNAVDGCPTPSPTPSPTLAPSPPTTPVPQLQNTASRPSMTTPPTRDPTLFPTFHPTSSPTLSPTDAPTAPKLRQTTVTFTYWVEHPSYLTNSKLFRDADGALYDAAEALLEETQPLAGYALSYRLYLEGTETALAGTGEVAECVPSRSDSTCTLLNTGVVLTHRPDLESEAVQFEFLKRNDEIVRSLDSVGKYRVNYVGDESLKTTTVITLKGVPNERMDGDRAGYFEEATREFLKKQVEAMKEAGEDGGGVHILTVKVEGQRVRSSDEPDPNFGDTRSRLLRMLGVGSWGPRRLQTSSSATSTVDITTVITGEHRPPPYIDFDVLVEDSIDSNPDQYTEELKAAVPEDDPYFAAIEEIVAVAVPPPPTPSPTPAPTSEPTSNATRNNGVEGAGMTEDEKILGFIPSGTTGIIIIAGIGAGLLVLIGMLWCYCIKRGDRHHPNKKNQQLFVMFGGKHDEDEMLKHKMMEQRAAVTEYDCSSWEDPAVVTSRRNLMMEPPMMESEVMGGGGGEEAYATYETYDGNDLGFRGDDGPHGRPQLDAQHSAAELRIQEYYERQQQRMEMQRRLQSTPNLYRDRHHGDGGYDNYRDHRTQRQRWHPDHQHQHRPVPMGEDADDDPFIHVFKETKKCVSGEEETVRTLSTRSINTRSTMNTRSTIDTRGTRGGGGGRSRSARGDLACVDEGGDHLSVDSGYSGHQDDYDDMHERERRHLRSGARSGRSVNSAPMGGCGDRHDGDVRTLRSAPEYHSHGSRRGGVGRGPSAEFRQEPLPMPVLAQHRDNGSGEVGTGGSTRMKGKVEKVELAFDPGVGPPGTGGGGGNGGGGGGRTRSKRGGGGWGASRPGSQRGGGGGGMGVGSRREMYARRKGGGCGSGDEYNDEEGERSAAAPNGGRLETTGMRASLDKIDVEPVVMSSRDMGMKSPASSKRSFRIRPKGGGVAREEFG